MKNSYKILNLSENASISDIKSSYYKLAKQYHPDYNQGDDNAETKFRAINQAYAKITKQMMQYCELLNVSISSDTTEINRAYNILRDKYSRERKKGSKSAKAKLKHTEEAYQFLSQKVKKHNEHNDDW